MTELEGVLHFAVCGLHMRGQALCHQLQKLGATFERSARTAPEYRLFALPHQGGLEKPGLIRMASGGSAIDLEIWNLSCSSLGAFMQHVPSPLAVGSILLEERITVLGFLCEAFVLEQPVPPKEITQFGGFLPYLSTQHAQGPHASA